MRGQECGIGRCRVGKAISLPARLDIDPHIGAVEGNHPTIRRRSQGHALGLKLKRQERAGPEQVLEDRDVPELPLEEKTVADYLRDNPEFFQNNPSLLATLQISLKGID